MAVHQSDTILCTASKWNFPALKSQIVAHKCIINNFFNNKKETHESKIPMNFDEFFPRTPPLRFSSTVSPTISPKSNKYTHFWFSVCLLTCHVWIKFCSANLHQIASRTRKRSAWAPNQIIMSRKHFCPLGHTTQSTHPFRSRGLVKRPNSRGSRIKFATWM